MFKSIVVAVDGSDQSVKAADVAIEMAKKFGSKLLALHIVILPFNEINHAGKEWQQEFEEGIRNQTSQWFTRIKRKGKENNVEVETEWIKTTKPIQYEITKYADARKAGLIVIGSKGRSDIKKLYLGSVASAVLTYASCPVLVIR